MTCAPPTAPAMDPFLPFGEWYCRSGGCAVRRVMVESALDGEALPAMVCPGCDERMTFLRWLCWETLLRHDRAA